MAFDGVVVSARPEMERAVAILDELQTIVSLRVQEEQNDLAESLGDEVLDLIERQRNALRMLMEAI